MNEYRVLKTIELGDLRASTGKTKHYHGETLLPTASELKIARYDDVDGIYLLHFDAQGNELTDTLHDTIEEAMAQAEWEYGVKPEEWIEAREKGSE